MNQGINDIFSIKAMHFDEIHTTSNHKFLVRKKYFEYSNKKRNRKFSKPEWISIEELMKLDKNGNYNYKNYYVGAAINQNSKIPIWKGINISINQHATKHINTLDMKDELLWYIVGRYLGDGWLTKNRKGKFRNNINGFKICCAKSEFYNLKNKLGTKYHYSITEEKTVYKFEFTNTEFATFLSQFGEDAKGKYLPGFVFDLPIDLLKCLLDGYIDADGCYEKPSDYIHTTSISRLLTYGISQCISKVYKCPTSVSINKVCEKK